MPSFQDAGKGASHPFVVPCLTPTVAIRGTPVKTCSPGSVCGDRRSLSCSQGWNEEQNSPLPCHGGQLRERLSIAGSLKLLSQFTRSLLSTGCHPDECPGPAVGVGPPPPPTASPLVCHLTFHTPWRLGLCATVLRVGDVVLVTTRRMNPNAASELYRASPRPYPHYRVGN